MRPLSLAAIAFAVAFSGGCLHRTAAWCPSGSAAREVAYGQPSGQPLLLDVYGCDKPGPHPAVILIHGGGWYAGDKRDCAPVARQLSALGFVCFAVNYRLTPAAHFPAQVQDCARAVRWVRAHAKDYGVDPNRIGAWGESAGGSMALMLGAMKPQDFQDPADPNRHLSAQVRCVVDLFGPAEFRRPAQWPVVAMRAAYGYFGGWPDAHAAIRAEASPAAHVWKTSRPVLLVHGDRDKLVPLQQSLLMKAALDQAGVENQLVVVPNAGHNLTGVSPQQRAQIIADAQQWLRDHLSH